MTISKDRRELYDSLPEETKDAVDGAFREARKALRAAGLKAAGDDRAENLVGAICRYVVESAK